MKGLVLDLPRSVADQLREGRHQQHTHSVVDTASENCRDVFNETTAQTLASSIHNSKSNAPTSPSVLPVILVDALQLVGYVPTTADEHAQLRAQVQEAIEISCSTNSSDDNDNSDETIAELMAAGIARHGTTTTCNSTERQQAQLSANTTETAFETLVIHYPEVLSAISTNTNSNSNSNNTRSITQMWTTLTNSTTSTPIPRRLLRHLQACQQTVRWKYHVHDALLQMIQTQELHSYQQQRAARLERLYDAREALALRVQTSHEQVALQREELHEAAVRMQATMCASTTHDLSRLWMDDDEYENQDEEPLMSDYDVYSSSSSSDDESQAEKDIDGLDDETVAIVIQENDNDTDNDSVVRRRRHERRNQQHARHKRAQALELERIQDEVTPHAFKATLAMHAALVQQLDRVDNLLESMQDEEWQAQEEDESNHCDVTSIDNSTSLLSQVLAMILGSTLAEPGTASEEHYAYLKREHEAILDEWKTRFGQPSPSTPKDKSAQDKSAQDKSANATVDNTADASLYLTLEQQQKCMRDALGIEENIWDDEADEQQSESKCLKMVGLRPGGRVP
jgi:hypothetical protein